MLAYLINNKELEINLHSALSHIYHIWTETHSAFLGCHSVSPRANLPLDRTVNRSCDYMRDSVGRSGSNYTDAGKSGTNYYTYMLLQKGAGQKHLLSFCFEGLCLFQIIYPRLYFISAPSYRSSTVNTNLVSIWVAWITCVTPLPPFRCIYA